jgi:hypothetical protein
MKEETQVKIRAAHQMPPSSTSAVVSTDTPERSVGK